MGLERLAPAKVNLFLHVGALGADGYHPVASLMTFADVGDIVRFEPAPAMDFAIEGPMGQGLSAFDGNLVTSARDLMMAAFDRDWTAFRLTLDKHLPIAAGVGGGSADAAAAMRLLGAAFNIPLSDDEGARLAEIARRLGADVPVCLGGAPVLASGRGDVFDSPPLFPDIDAVLVNPGVPSPTGRVFAAYDAAGAPGDALQPPWVDALNTAEDVAGYLAACRNDLQAPAIGLTPQIGETLALLDRQPETLLARMSGSGATCFALVRDHDAALDLATELAAAHPDWWVRACRLKGFRP